ncbi:ubiquitin-like domain-containing protein CIP73 isoform X2 [Dendrobium catenatum]|uniref:ubiquitin-like domain-containing protein CIP73 isoform X2 n=1 Tax=Dendrobium catenatum TaxID=906689 RepID=UPI0009F59AA6|nr:ubiquitin-like domain-containing protein CIP73 isoform X2 [Dendrobium catenatum]
MGTSGAAKMPMCNSDVTEESETTVEIKIKTLDSQTYTLRVNKCVPVPALKEQIATVTGVLSEQQRLICRGKVLKDDQLLSAYHVEDGHTLHLVVRQPYQSATFIGTEGQSANNAPDSMPNHPNQVSRTVVLEAVNIDQADLDPTLLNRIMTNILNSFGATNGSGNVSTNIQEANSGRLPRSFGHTGVSSSQNQPHITTQTSQNLPNISSQRIASDRQPAAFQFPTAISSGSQNLPAIPHSLTTLQQYLIHLKNVFWRDIPGSNDGDHNSSGEASTVHHNEGGDNISLSHHPSRRGDIPTPAALAEILHSTRQLLAEHVEERLLGLARTLENDTNLTDYEVRSNVQSSAFRTGFFLQNLGSLFLELGRTTMTLRMGQIPAEAVVNAGPAVFISASGPNPVMVQPVPFYPAPSFGGMDMGSTNSVHGPEGERVGSATFPRNIDIRIHAASSQSGLGGGAQQQQENLDSTRASANGDSVHQPVQAHPRSGTLTGEFGLRVVPVRTVVAMPAGISNSQSNLSDNLAPLLHPLISRIRQRNSGSVNDALSPQAFPFHQGGIEANQESIPDSLRQIFESYIGGSVQEAQVPSYTVPVVSESNMSPVAQIDHQGTHVYITSQQMPNNYGERNSHVNDVESAGQGSLPQYLNIFNQPSSTVVLGEQVNTGGVDQQGSAPDSHTEQAITELGVESNEASVSVNDQGVLFSSYLRHLMPLLIQEPPISQDVSNVDSNSLTLDTQRADLNDPSSSQHQRDPPEPPSPKRHKEGENECSQAFLVLFLYDYGIKGGLSVCTGS